MDILNKLYAFFDICGEPQVRYQCDSDGDWEAEIEPDGKLIHNSFIGIGDSKQEALDDAVSRLIDHTPIVNDVPFKKLLNLLDFKTN
tara:strand:- start:7915 stop:8175 length:261 start_codon:yes stop_codon:yes gene_type:complete